MNDTDEWPDPATKAHALRQTSTLHEQAAKGGLRFEAYLPPRLALWLLKRIEEGVFVDPSEAVFVILGEYEELEPHADLRHELFRRRIQAALNEPGSDIATEETFADLRKKLMRCRPEPARWEKQYRR